MPAPVIAAGIATLARAIAASGGRAFASAGGRALASNGGRRAASWFVRKKIRERSPSHDEARENVRDFYRRARSKIGTPRPTMRQYAQVARQEREKKSQDDANKQLKLLSKRAAGLAATFVALRAVTRDYSKAGLQRGDALRTFNGKIGSSMARYDANNLRRMFRHGAAVGQTTSALIDARGQRDDTWEPLKSKAENLGNVGRIAATKTQVALGEALDKLGIDEAMGKVTGTLAKLLDIELEKKHSRGEEQRALKTWLRAAGSMPSNRAPGENNFTTLPPRH